MIPDIGGAEMMNGLAKASFAVKRPVGFSHIESVDALAGCLLDGPASNETITSYFFGLMESLDQILIFFHSISRVADASSSFLYPPRVVIEQLFVIGSP